LQGIFYALNFGFGIRRPRGVEHDCPRSAAVTLGQGEKHVPIESVEEQQRRFCTFFDVASEPSADRQGLCAAPMLVLQIAAVGMKPAYQATVAKARPAKQGVVGAKRDHAARELGQRAVTWLDLPPAKPADFVVMTIGVVVTVLAAPKLVARQKHRRAMRYEQCGQDIALLTFANFVDVRILGWSFDAVVAGAIVIGSIRVVLSIGFVVLSVVRNKVG